MQEVAVARNAAVSPAVHSTERLVAAAQLVSRHHGSTPPRTSIKELLRRGLLLNASIVSSDQIVWKRSCDWGGRDVVTRRWK